MINLKQLIIFEMYNNDLKRSTLILQIIITLTQKLAVNSIKRKSNTIITSSKYTVLEKPDLIFKVAEE